MKKTSFNEWIKATAFFPVPAIARLAEVWVGRKGRLTRESVEKRAQTEYQAPPGTGYAAWDAYQAFLSAQPPPEPQKDPS